MNQLGDPFAPKLTPPYYAAILSSKLDTDPAMMNAYAGECFRLAARSPAFLGAEKARYPNGFGIAAVFWSSRAALEAWISDVYEAFDDLGYDTARDAVFDRFVFRVAKIEKEVWSDDPDGPEPPERLR